MKIRDSILLGSACGFLAIAGAQAADLPSRKAAPIADVKVCDIFGGGYFYIPGSDVCLKIGGVVRAEYYYRGAAPASVANQAAYNLAGVAYWRDAIQWRARDYVTIDARSTTDFGDLRGYTAIRYSNDSRPTAPFGGGKISAPGLPLGAKEYAGSFQGLSNSQVNIDAAYVQWAGLTAGVAHSFFDFYTHNYEIGSYSVGASDQPLDLVAYTLKFGGFSATASVEDPTSRRIGNSTADTTAGDVNPANSKTGAYLTYGALDAPDIVGNLRLDGAWGNAQIAGALHQVNSNPITLAGGTLPAGYTPSTVWGGALEAGAKFRLDSVSPGDNMTGQITWSQGAMDYVNAWNYWSGTTNVYDKNIVISVPANDAFVLPDGSIGLEKSWGGFLGYQHFWIPTVRSNLFGSYLTIKNPGAAQLLSAGTDNAAVWDIGFNTFWSPVRALDIGAELVYTNVQLSGNYPLATGTILPNSTTKAPVPADSNDWRGRVRIQVVF